MIGNVPVMLLSRSVRNGVSGDLLHANVLVCGSVLGVNENILGSPNIANADYLLDLLGSLANRAPQVRIANKTIGSSELGVTIDQVFIIGGVFMILLPLMVLVAGIVVWLRRRHK
jgi:hypothetical protein